MNRNLILITQTRGATFFYGYTIIVAGFFIQAVVWGISNSFGVFFDPFIKEFGWSRATISGAASLGFLVHGFSSILLGNLNDRFGPRLIMSCCGIFLGLGFFLMGGLNSIWQLYLFYGLIASVGLGGIDVIPLSTVSRWFQKKRGMMSGIIKVGTGVGMVVMPFFINWLLRHYGWRHSFFVLAVVMIFSVLFMAQLLVRDPALKDQAIDNGVTLISLNHGAGHGVEEGLTFKETVGTRQFWTICLVYFVILFCVYTILMHIVQHAIDLGIPRGIAAGILSTVGGVSIIGRFFMGDAGDRIGEKKALLICLFTLLVALFWLQSVENLWMFYLFATLYGFAHGGFFSLVSPIIAKFFGTKSHGLLLGVVIFSGTIGGAIGPVLAGYVFDVTTSYRIVFWVLAFLCAFAIALTASLRPLIKNQTGKNL